MNRNKIIALVIMAPFFVAQIANSKPYKYSDGKISFAGEYFAAPGEKKSPGLVLIHNWMGVTAETVKQSERFQKLGYSVLAADIYGEGIRPTNPKDAGALATQYKTDRKLLRERVGLAIRELSKMKNVDPTQIVVLGYCFGGTAAIEAARSGENIKGAISFHGGLDSPTPADGAKIKAKILALHGADDPFVPAADLTAFESEMKSHRVNFEIVKYPGAVHSFTDLGAGTDNSKGAAYNKKADESSFEKATLFLKSVF